MTGGFRNLNLNGAMQSATDYVAYGLAKSAATAMLEGVTEIMNVIGHDSTATTLSNSFINFNDTNPLHAKLKSVILASANNGDRMSKLFEQYMAVFEKRYAMYTTKDLFTTDQIDLRDYMTIYPKITGPDGMFIPEIVEWLDKHKLLAYIPCYTTGAILFDQYLAYAYRVLDINLDENYYYIAVQEFYSYYGKYVPCVSGIYKVYYDAAEARLRSAIILNELQGYPRWTDILRAVSTKKLNWSSDDKQLWNKTIVKFANTIAELPDYTEKYVAADDAIMIFMQAISIANYYLDTTKKKSRPRPVEPAGLRIASFEQPQDHPRRVRQVDMIKFTSASVPRFQTEDMIIRYKTESWRQRGHIRRYASGKEVWIEPQIKHRRCVAGLTPTGAVSPATIQFNTAEEA